MWHQLWLGSDSSLCDVMALCRKTVAESDGPHWCGARPDLCSRWQPHAGVCVQRQDSACVGPQRWWYEDEPSDMAWIRIRHFRPHFVITEHNARWNHLKLYWPFSSPVIGESSVIRRYFFPPLPFVYRQWVNDFETDTFINSVLWSVSPQKLLTKVKRKKGSWWECEDIDVADMALSQLDVHVQLSWSSDGLVVLQATWWRFCVAIRTGCTAAPSLPTPLFCARLALEKQYV